MSRSIETRDENGLVRVYLSRDHGNAINLELVDELTAAFRRIETDDAVRGVLLAARGKLFCPGLDLQELIELNRAQMKSFVERFNACILALYTCCKPVVASLHGHAVAGGCVLALTADWRVLHEERLIGLNEVRVGVPFPYGVAMLLRETVPQRHLEEIALFGNNYGGADAVRVGLVQETHAGEGLEEHAMSRLEELASRDPAAFAITKRYLRSATVERILTDEARLASDFLERWWAPGTRKKIAAIVEELKNRG